MISLTTEQAEAVSLAIDAVLSQDWAKDLLNDNEWDQLRNVEQQCDLGLALERADRRE